MLLFAIEAGDLTYSADSVNISTITDKLLLFTCQNPETYKPKFHCRRQSGMNFGYVTENGVNSNVCEPMSLT